jgi:RHS repeat-associated protein
MAVYQADTLSERPIYGSSRLGNLTYASKPGYRTVGYKQYELSNHLGNVLAVVSDRIHMRTDSTWAEVISRSDYYPFGLEMTGRTESVSYRYGFNGKEKDTLGMGGGGNTYDYGFRIYNPKVAKFLSVDPLTREYAY